jgi:hypothetical protein
VTFKLGAPDGQWQGPARLVFNAFPGLPEH